MLSTNSLAAFSAATTTAPVNRPNELRLAREQIVGPNAQAGGPTKNAVPTSRPPIAPPRGSLINLSV